MTHQRSTPDELLLLLFLVLHEFSSLVWFGTHQGKRHDAQCDNNNKQRLEELIFKTAAAAN